MTSSFSASRRNRSPLPTQSQREHIRHRSAYSCRRRSGAGIGAVSAVCRHAAVGTEGGGCAAVLGQGQRQAIRQICMVPLSDPRQRPFEQGGTPVLLAENALLSTRRWRERSPAALRRADLRQMNVERGRTSPSDFRRLLVFRRIGCRAPAPGRGRRSRAHRKYLCVAQAAVRVTCRSCICSCRRWRLALGCLPMGWSWLASRGRLCVSGLVSRHIVPHCLGARNHSVDQSRLKGFKLNRMRRALDA